MYWWYHGGGRLCPFGHRWVISRLSQEDFEVNETCSWCGKRRVRALLPRDVQKRRQGLAYEKGRQQRLRILNEINYESARGGTEARNRVSELQKDLVRLQRTVFELMHAEKGKRDQASRDRLGELGSELRGLFFGRN